MTKQDYLKLKRLWNKLVDELEEKDLSEEEKEQLLELSKQKFAESQNFNWSDYLEYEEVEENTSNKTLLNEIQILKEEVGELKTKDISLEEVEEIAKKHIQPPIYKTEIVKEILKETTIEKPKIIETTKHTTVKEKYDDSKLKKELSNLNDKVSNIKIPEPVVLPDLNALKEELRSDFSTLLEHNINTLDMPNFRKLAMGLQAQIDGITTPDIAALWGSITGTLSDQTDLQTALDAKATTELDNLGTTAINTSLVSDTNNTDDLGSDSIRWRNGHFGTRLSIGTVDSPIGVLDVSGNSRFVHSAPAVGITQAGIDIKENHNSTGGYTVMEIAGTSAIWTTGKGMKFYNHGVTPQINVGAPIIAEDTFGALMGIFGTTAPFGTNDQVRIGKWNGEIGLLTMKYATSPYPDFTMSAPTFHFKTKEAAAWADGSVTLYGTERLTIEDAAISVHNQLLPGTSDASALGSTTKQWSDLFLASGGTINFDDGDMVFTHTANKITLSGGDFVNQGSTGATISFIDGQAIRSSSTLYFDSSGGNINFRPGIVTALTLEQSTNRAVVITGLVPDANDGAFLGTSALGFSDLFLAEGGVINWDNGDLTLTQTGDTLALAGGGLNIQGSLQVDSITNDTGLAHGTYSPTVSNASNLDADPTMGDAQYMRVGNTVTVSGAFEADVTTAGFVSFEIDLPVASDFTSMDECAGTGASVSEGTGTFEGAEIVGNGDNDTAKITWFTADEGGRRWSYHFTYTVV